MKIDNRSIFWVKLAVSTFLVVLLVYMSDIDRVKENFSSIPLYAVVLAWVYYSFCQLLSAHRWQLLLTAKNIHVPIRKLFSFYMVGMFLNNFLPGAVGGDVVKTYDLYKYIKDVNASASTVFLERFSGLVGLTIISVAALFFYMTSMDSLLVVGVVLSVVVFLVVVSICLWSHRVFSLANRFYSKVFPEKIGQRLNAIHEAVYSYRFHKKTMAQTVVYSIIIQLLFALYYGLAALVLGIDVNIFYFILFLPVITIVTMVPISIGGLGIREMAMVLLFAEVGVSSADILSISLSVHFINTALSLWGGAIFAFRKREQQAHQESPSLRGINE